jgi:hypothetical protein
VERQLEKVLVSTSFRGSPRCTDFLRYVVTAALNGKRELLHERAIGMDLFGKPAGYDPSEDSLVRVKATEVRRRLAQYYAAPESQAELRFELPTGSYMPEFRWPAAAEPRPPLRIRKRTLAALLAASAAAIGLAAVALKPATPLERFWEPILRSEKPVMLTLGNAPVYILSTRAIDRYFETHPRPSSPGPHAVRPDAAFTVSGGDLLSQQGHYVGVGGAQAVHIYASYLTKMGKESFLRTGSEYSFADFRSNPAIMIGAFSSQWTLRATENLRFSLDRRSGLSGIADRENPDRFWGLNTFTDATDLIDYALVSRVAKSDSGEPQFVAAGITQYGCTSAAEFLTQEKHFAAALVNAPPGWHRGNMQVVLRARVVGGTAAPPEVVATHFWE